MERREMEQQRKLISIPKGAAIVGKSPSWLRSKVKAGVIHCVRPGGVGAHPRVYVDDLERLRDQSTEAGAPEFMKLTRDLLLD